MTIVAEPQTDRAAQHRAAIVAGLRELAAYFAEHPDVPVPTYPSPMLHHIWADSNEEGIATVAAVAAMLGVPMSVRADGGHYIAGRQFGPFRYEVVYITPEHTRKFEAQESYNSVVVVADDVDLHGADLHPQPGQPAAPIPPYVHGEALGGRTGEHPPVRLDEPIGEDVTADDAPVSEAS